MPRNKRRPPKRPTAANPRARCGPAADGDAAGAAVAAGAKSLEATFDHGEKDGYGLWLDPSVKDNPVYAEHWAGQREVTVRIEPDQIVIRRPGAPEPDDSGDGED